MAAVKVKEQTVLQFAGKSAEIGDLSARIRQAWKDEGHKVGDLKTVDIYVKPEEDAVYYVVNGETEGKIKLF